MIFRLVVQALCLFLSAPLASAADPPTCDGISATRRIVGYYDTYFAGTPCGTQIEGFLGVSTSADNMQAHFQSI
jgi:hypothetical protein